MKQMVVRANQGHHRVLSHWDAKPGTVIATAMDSVGSLRGLRTVAQTLRRWGCVTPEGALTDRGRELLAALNERREGAAR